VSRVAIIAAMPGELKPLVNGWHREHRNAVDLWRHESGNGEWVAACAGAGVAAATRAFCEIEKDGPVNRVISTGWAGALRDDLLPGRAYRVSGVVDARTGEHFPIAEWREEGSDGSKSWPAAGPWLVTSPKVADAAEKQRLAVAYDAGLVDMEAAAVARLAEMRGIPFYCVKGISDGYREQMPDFNNFITENGKFRIAAFVVFCIFKPWYWPALLRMGENSKKASLAIRDSLLENLQGPGVVTNRNGYPNLKR
jgi:adenosylhomocysteine nucleosidase